MLAWPGLVSVWRPNRFYITHTSQINLNATPAAAAEAVTATSTAAATEAGNFMKNPLANKICIDRTHKLALALSLFHSHMHTILYLSLFLSLAVSLTRFLVNLFENLLSFRVNHA